MKHDMKAILGEDFFKEEVRCGYVVSEKMKFTWAMEMDLYLLFSEICDKYGLSYFIFYGGLLGAIRHDGFIPWDDDLDVAMPREDFDIFLKIAPEELKEPYALQTPYTYPNCYYSVVTMRNSMGTFTPEIFSHLDYNKGVPLDIFPIDHCDPATYDEDRKLIYRKIKRCSTWMKYKAGVRGRNIDEDIELYGIDNPLAAWEEVHRIASNPNYIGSGFCGVPTLIPNIQKAASIFPTECFSSCYDHSFEGITVPVPKGYDTILSVIYGDYMSFPPVAQRGVKTDGIIFDPYVPYQDFKF